jgi:hypothetical protein
LIGDEVKNVSSRIFTRIDRLVDQLHDEGFRNSYLSRQLKAFLAAQIRALRGEKTQTAFGKDLGKPQSVVSRLENERLSGLHVQTLIDIAQKLKIGVIIRFVEFTEFLRYTEDYSDQALAPAPYDQGKVDSLARWSESLSFEPSQTQLAQIDKEFVTVITNQMAVEQSAHQNLYVSPWQANRGTRAMGYRHPQGVIGFPNALATPLYAVQTFSDTTSEPRYVLYAQEIARLKTENANLKMALLSRVPGSQDFKWVKNFESIDPQTARFGGQPLQDVAI